MWIVWLNFTLWFLVSFYVLFRNFRAFYFSSEQVSSLYYNWWIDSGWHVGGLWLAPYIHLYRLQVSRMKVYIKKIDWLVMRQVEKQM
jgi:hypothetical protein